MERLAALKNAWRARRVPGGGGGGGGGGRGGGRTRRRRVAALPLRAGAATRQRLRGRARPQPAARSDLGVCHLQRRSLREKGIAVRQAKAQRPTLPLDERPRRRPRHAAWPAHPVLTLARCRRGFGAAARPRPPMQGKAPRRFHSKSLPAKRRANEGPAWVADGGVGLGGGGGGGARATRDHAALRLLLLLRRQRSHRPAATGH